MENPAQAIAEAADVTPAYARMILAGSRKPALTTALRIFDQTGLKFGPLANLSDADVETARRMAA